MPLLMTRQAMARLAEGAELEVLATDPLAALDLQGLCLREGHTLLAMEQQAQLLRAVIRKGPRLRQ